MNGVRNSLGMMIVFTLVIGFGLLLIQAGTPAAQASEAAVTPLAWMGGCYPPVLAVGRYFPGDAPCRPSQTISLTQLEAALDAHGVLAAGESLSYAPQPRARALKCWGLVMNGNQAAGWVCTDAAGLVRMSLDGRQLSARWQLLADGTWTSVEP